MISNNQIEFIEELKKKIPKKKYYKKPCKFGKGKVIGFNQAINEIQLIIQNVEEEK